MNYLPEIKVIKSSDTTYFEPPRLKEEHIRRFLIETKEHSLNVESIVFQLGWEDLAKGDFQRPHDISGEYNKFEKDILLYLPYQYQRNPEYNKQYVWPAIARHQKQNHHQQYGDKDSEIMDHFNLSCIIIGAIDSYSALREERFCFGGAHTPEEISRLYAKNQLGKMVIGLEIQTEIERLSFPNIHLTSVLDMPKNLKVSSITADATQEITKNAVYILSEMGYDMDEILKTV